MKKTLTAITVILLLMLSSCTITKKYHITDSSLIQEDEHDGIKVKCEYLDRQEIIKRHGAKNNPFLAPPMIITPHPAIIFELTITNMEETAVKLDIRDIDLYYNDKSYMPMSQSDMEIKIDDDEIKGFYKNKQRKMAEKKMLSNVETIPGMSEKKGYLVFMRNFKKKGNAELVLLFRTQDDMEAGEFTFNYDFYMKR